MKMKKYIHVLSVLLIAALLCGLFPAAYAEGETASAADPYLETAEASPASESAETAAPAASREETMLGFLKLVMQAEAEKDPTARAALCEEAKELWNIYLETAPVGRTLYADDLENDEHKFERQDMLFDLMQYVMAAETENDPAVRAGYYLQADAIWYAYLDLVNSAAAEAERESSLDPAREKALHDFLLGMADPDMAPEDQARFLEEAGKLWDTYYGMVIDAMEDGKPAPAEVPAPADAPLEPETKAEPAQPEEPENLYADEWDELEAMLQEMMGDFGPFGGQGPEMFGFPNPWVNTKWLEEAILVSGVKLTPPEKQALPEGMKLFGYCAMNGTVEVDYTDGENELMLRASLIDEGYTLSGDYNSYSKEWTENFDGVAVDCLGDGKTVNVASWQQGDVAFAVTMACGLEGQGLTVDELRALVAGTSAVPVREGNPMDIYADKWDIFADPILPSEEPAPETSVPGTDEPTPKTGTERKPGPSFGRRRGSQFDFGPFGW